ncbi:MAG: hypothetical protein Kow00122_17360 [Thermoleophilia bacterium]
MEHAFVLGFVSHNQAQLLVALPAQTLEHLLKPQQQLLERSLERIGRRDCLWSTNDSEETVPVVPSEGAKEPRNVMQESVSHRAGNSSPWPLTAANPLGVKLKLLQMGRETASGQSVKRPVESTDVCLMDGKTSDDEVVVGIVDASALVNVQEDHELPA